MRRRTGDVQEADIDFNHKTPTDALLKPEPIDWEGEDRSAKCRQQFEDKDGTQPFEYFVRDMERRKFFPSRDERPA